MVKDVSGIVSRKRDLLGDFPKRNGQIDHEW